MYGHRLWASPGTFTPADVDFMTEPFADRGTAARGLGRLPAGARTGARASRRSFETMVDVPTLLLYGPDDHVVGPDFLALLRGGVHRTGSGRWSCPRAGHFLQWERADLLNGLVAGWFSQFR